MSTIEGNIMHHDVSKNPSHPTIPIVPTIKAMGHALRSHNVSGNSTAPIPMNHPSTRQCMKFNDYGVWGNKTVCVWPQSIEKYNNELVGWNILIIGTITVVTNAQRDCHYFQVLWTNKGSFLFPLIRNISIPSSIMTRKIQHKPSVSSEWHMTMTMNTQKLTANADAIFAKNIPAIPCNTGTWINTGQQMWLSEICRSCTHNSKNDSSNYSNSKHTYFLSK